MRELASVIKDNTTIGIFFVIATFIVVMFALILVYKLLNKAIMRWKGFKAKIGNNEVSIGTDANNSNRDSNEQAPVPISANGGRIDASDQNNTKRIIHLITEIVQMAEDIAWKKTKCRQELYDQQMKEVSFKLDSFRNHVMLDYASMNENSSNNDIVLLILNSLLKEHIESKFDSIFKADKLAESTKEKVLEANRGYFNDFDTQLISNLKTKYGSCTAIDIKSFTEAIVKNKDLLKENSAAALDKCYDLDAKYVEDTNNLNKEDLAQRIARLINTYDISLNEELIKQHTWSNKSAPNDVIGG